VASDPRADEFDFILWDCQVEQRQATPAEQDVILRHIAHAAKAAADSLDVEGKA